MHVFFLFFQAKDLVQVQHIDGFHSAEHRDGSPEIFPRIGQQLRPV